MKKLILILITIFLIGCDKKVAPSISDDDFFKNYLNIETPKEISSFEGKMSDVFPVFSSSGYLKYKAEPSYFDKLATNKNFLGKSKFNKIIKTVVFIGSFPVDFTYWTKEKIDTKNKKYYKGVFFPYVHYILYDKNSKQSWHFITGMRD